MARSSINNHLLKAHYQSGCGCTRAQWDEMQEVKVQMMASGRAFTSTPTKCYSVQRSRAIERGIGWEFTLGTWWEVWKQSGKWFQRGTYSGQYVMCRKGDVGPYSPSNVYIETCEHNSSTNRKKKSGLPTGVRRVEHGKRFAALRRFKGKQYYLGSFETVEEAEAAYLNSERLMKWAA